MISHTEPNGYYPVPFTTELWEHQTRKTYFCLYVDNFGIKYFSKDDSNNLLKYLSKHYAVSTDWEGLKYLGLTIGWNYKEGYVDILMPEYVTKVLERTAPLHNFQEGRNA